MSTNLGSKSLLRSRRKCENFSKINFVMIIGRGPALMKNPLITYPWWIILY